MKSFQATDHLDNDLPDVLLLDKLFVILTFANSLKNIAIISEFHNNAVHKLIITASMFHNLPERVGRLIEKCLSVGSDKRVLDASQYTHFI